MRRGLCPQETEGARTATRLNRLCRGGGIGTRARFGIGLGRTIAGSNPVPGTQPHSTTFRDYMSHCRLEVHEGLKEDVYRDRVRIPAEHRDTVREGRVCKVSTNGHSILTEVRGIQSEQRPIIRMDEVTRGSLGLAFLETYAFEIREASWPEQFRWAWNSSDSASRIAARLGLVGVILGLLGLLVAITPIVLK